MSDFVTKTTAPAAPAPDPTKHVNFTYGMVLGVDDFTQEFAYHDGRDRWLARDAVGYGVVRGLQVLVEDDGANGPRVSVRPGAALSPQGHLICVTPEQCASLNAWLARQDPALLARAIAGAAPNETVTLYVSLCYRHCPTDTIPIPGEPCRSEDDAMAASRLQDDFQLDLRLQPPAQAEEDGLRDVVGWLRQVPLDPGAATTLDEFLAALRAALHVDAASSPPRFAYGTPDPGLRIPTDQTTNFWRAAFRVWTTELRPQQVGQGAFVAFVRQVLADRAGGGPPTSLDDFRAALRSAARVADSMVQPGFLDQRSFAAISVPGAAADQEPYWQAAFEVWRQEVLPRWVSKGGVCATSPDEECLLLAALVVPLTAAPDRRVNGDAAAVLVDEARRPVVVHLRMLQEWALTAPAAASGGPVTLAGDVSGPAAATQIDRLQGKGVDAAAPADQQVLTFDAASDSWRPVALPAVGVPDVTLAGDVSGPATATQIDRLQGKGVDAAAPADQQVLTFDAASDSWRPVALPAVDPPAVVLEGDVAGPAGATTVRGLQNVPVAAGAPGEGQVLTVVGGQWQAATPPVVPDLLRDVVEHPKDLPRYAIVAAGLIRGDGSAIGPTYNRLTGDAVGDADLLLRFGDPGERFGYRLPDDSFTYIVKVLPAFSLEQVPSVAFRGFDPDGIHLVVLSRGQFVSQRELRLMEFMVEVSYFER